jgi:phospholipid/cholesterol/gamma-HCH transport system permease protein
MDIMGVNSAGYLVMPKIFAMVTLMPALVIISITIGVLGGMVAGVSSGVLSLGDYEYGIQYAFNPFLVVYTIIKALTFAFIIMSVSSYQGYHVKGGALEVGKASTKAVVYSSILILIFNLLITQLLLT